MITERFPFYPEQIARELKWGRAWVCADRDKCPLVPFERRRASSTDELTWRNYEEAVSAFEAYPSRYAGVGRIIRGDDPYVGIDLDDCRDPRSGEITTPAREILELLNSYSEVSPSMRGVKTWVKATLPRSYVKEGIELYGSRRYFTVTGMLLPQYPATIEERQDEIDELVGREFPRMEERSSRFAAPYDGPQVVLLEILDGVEVLEEVPDSLGVKYRIRCPWMDVHTGGDIRGTYVGQRAEGPTWFRCWHAHCAHRTWRDFRRKVIRKRLPKSKELIITRPGFTGTMKARTHRNA